MHLFPISPPISRFSVRCSVCTAAV